jgi:alkanesulfonate monooxygenase SsuD/methylene tetrahydromethanopterin reductase-like flavin-dependent oxidoreductase (luciferase family)
VRFGVLTLPNEPWEALVGRWGALEEQGWDAIYVADQLANPFRPEQPWFDGWACVQALAHVTERARIGPLVTSIVFRNPAAVARAALTADHASGGRLLLGLGAGGAASDHALAGVDEWPPRERARHLLEFAVRTRQLLDDDKLRPRPVAGRIPLVLGGDADGTLRLAAELADGWNTYGGRGLTAEQGRARAAERLAFLDAACGESGRTVTRSVLLGHRFVAEEPFASEDAFAEVARTWRALGFDELIIYADPYFMVPLGAEAPTGIVERIARDVLPELRRGLRPSG